MSYDGPTSLYIGGEWTDGETDAVIETVDPATEDTYATVAAADPADVDAAVEAAAATARDSEWRSMDPSDRAAILHDFADALAARRAEITLAESRDNGKTHFE